MPVASKVIKVPNDQVGRLIGKGGCTIRQLQEVAGAHVDIAKQCPPDSTLRDVTITGSDVQISRAEQLVNQKLAGQPLISAASATWSQELAVRINVQTENMGPLASVADQIVRDLHAQTAVAIEAVKGADGSTSELSLRGDHVKLSLCCSLLQSRFAGNPTGLGELQAAFAAAVPLPQAPAAAAAYAAPAMAAYAGYAGYPGYGAAAPAAPAATSATSASAAQQYPGYDAATAAYYQQYQQYYAAYAAAAAGGASAQNPYAAYYGQTATAAVGGAGRTTTQLSVPNELVGRIIGKGGASIKAIQEQSGAHVDIPPDTHAPMRVITITGDGQQISACTTLINQKMASRF